MQLTATAGLGFLLAVLWFDLMFDVQARGGAAGPAPVEALDSIAAYYRRVTTDARPMNRLIALVMLVTLGCLVGEVVRGDVPAGAAWATLTLTAIGVGLAAARTVRNAQRLGSRRDDPARSALARGILRDHLVCLVVIVAALVVQIGFG